MFVIRKTTNIDSKKTNVYEQIDFSLDYLLRIDCLR